MGDYLATIAGLAMDKAKHGYEFSDVASAEIFELFDQISRMRIRALLCDHLTFLHLAHTLVREEYDDLSSRHIGKSLKRGLASVA